DSVRLVAALGQIITHVRSCTATWIIPAPPEVWVQRFRTSLDFLIGDEAHTPMVAQFLSDFAQRRFGIQSLIEVESLLAQVWSEQTWRGAYLNGDLGIAELGTMSQVPHKVIIVCGINAESLAPILDCDNLGGNSPGQDPRLQARQVLCDALLSARKKFAVIYSDSDPVSAYRLPTPTFVEDLLTWAHMMSPPQQPINTLIQERPPKETRADLPRITRGVYLTPAPSDEVDIEDLCDLFVNPAGYWLRKNAGLTSSVLSPPDPLPTQIPLSLNALDTWQITNRMVGLLLQDKPLDAILESELRRGVLPPSHPGATIAQDCLAQARDIVNQAKPYSTQELSWRCLDVPSDEAPTLTGQVCVRGNRVLEIMAGRVGPRHQIAAWIKILALSAAHPDQHWEAVLIGKKSSVTLSSPNRDDALFYLNYLRRIHQTGLGSVLPLPPAPSAHLGKTLAFDLRPNLWNLSKLLEKTWEQDPAWSHIWPTHEAMTAEPTHQGDALTGTGFPDRFSTLAYGVYAPMIRQGGGS
ncbi:MAG: exodeoxyribonuclease V subunit gamma, partial [Propionibacteriaceae bacterium]|nr:exodeoxyribonuclease V subunit gamma [Propionibacteriaceae bacterium]